MGILDIFKGKKLASSEAREAPPPSDYGMISPAYSSFSFSELSMNSTVVACTNFIANAVSVLPLNLYFRNPTDGSRKRADWHPLYKVLKLRPNPDTTAVAFQGRITRDIYHKGTAYVWKNEIEVKGLSGGKKGKAYSLHRLNPDAVREVYSGNETRFQYAGKEYGRDKIFRIPSLIVDEHGKGFAPVEFVKNAIRLGIQLDEYSLSSLANGLNTKLLVDMSEVTPAPANETEAAKRAKSVADYLKRNYAGAENAGNPLVAFPGMGKVSPIQGQSSNKDAELLESRKWQEIEICKGLGVFPFMINGSYSVPYGNLEAAMTAYLNFYLSPLLKHLEAIFAAELLDEYEQGAYYFEYDYSVFLKPDAKSRSEIYSKLFAMGAISPGGICEKENLEPPPEGADARFVPANMMPLRQDVIDAFMAGAKLKAEQLGEGGGLSQPPDPARAAGDDKQ